MKLDSNDEKSSNLSPDLAGSAAPSKSCMWGSQTQRAIENFNIGSEKIPVDVIRSLALIKNAAACVNVSLGDLDEKVGECIVEACEEVIGGKWQDQFPLSVWQSGSGTQSNMNMNEVVASLASSRMKLKTGKDFSIHPNDHVNMSQSSNDTFPTAMHIAAFAAINTSLKPALKTLYSALSEKSEDFKDICKIGRTHTQDATPLTLGQEFSGYAHQVSENIDRLKTAAKELLFLAQGGTAVGTGLNTKAKFASKVVAKISDMTGYPFTIAPNRFALQAAHDGLVNVSGSLNTMSVSLIKIANDLRFLASGPRCGFGEIILPANEPGSSIMPGKINPTQCESITMVCYRVIGNHTTISMAGSGGHFELNACKPVMIYSLLQSIYLLSDGIRSFTDRCVKGIVANKERIKSHLDNSLMLITSLSPIIGYDNCAKLVKLAYDLGISLRDANLKLGIVDDETFLQNIDPSKMLGPHD